MGNLHKHRNAIIAWANGAKIDVKECPDGNWRQIDEPEWCEDREYRIRPKGTKKNGWINIYNHELGPSFGAIHPTREFACDFADGVPVACIYIEWEEET